MQEYTNVKELVKPLRDKSGKFQPTFKHNPASDWEAWTAIASIMFFIAAGAFAWQTYENTKLRLEAMQHGATVDTDGMLIWNEAK